MQVQLAALINEYCASSTEIKLLDVGCGEGFYANELSKVMEKLDIYAIDNVKDAIILGARMQEPVKEGW